MPIPALLTRTSRRANCSIAKPTALASAVRCDVANRIRKFGGEFRQGLLSAAGDGQWTQARKASVASWDISDSKCQLCHLENGTVEHRFHCAKTLPDGGWPVQPTKANLAVQRISAIRRRHLKHHGMLVLRLPAPPINISGSFEWI